MRFVGVNGVDDAGAAQAFERAFGIPYPSIADADATAVAALQGRVPADAVPTTDDQTKIFSSSSRPSPIRRLSTVRGPGRWRRGAAGPDRALVKAGQP